MNRLTTDGHKAYLDDVEDALGAEIDYAQLRKIYGPTRKETNEVRCSLSQCMGAKRAVISGMPDYQHISTSFTERQNLTMKMSMCRFTRLTNDFSKKVVMFLSQQKFHHTLQKACLQLWPTV